MSLSTPSGLDIQKEKGPVDTGVYPGGFKEGRHCTKEAGEVEREESQAKRERQEQGRETWPTGWAWEVSTLQGLSVEGAG